MYKIGKINVSDNDVHYLMNNTNLQYKIVDYTTEKCDLVYTEYNINPYEIKYLMSLAKGNPKFIMTHGEFNACPGWHMVKNKLNKFFCEAKQDKFTMSHFNDSPTNIFVPYCWIDLNEEYLINDNKNVIKTKFCNFISSDPSIERFEIFNYINDNYKHIDAYGSVNQNMGNKYWKEHEFDIEIPKYKFSLVIENESSLWNENYVTEKITRALHWGTVPIYWGSHRINEILNTDAFIDITGKTYEEALELIKIVNNDDSLYNKMLHKNPLLENINTNYFINKRAHFVKNILTNKINIIKKHYIIGVTNNLFEQLDMLLKDNNIFTYKLTNDIINTKCDLIVCNNIYMYNTLYKLLNYQTKLLTLNNGINNYKIENNYYHISNDNENLHNLVIPNNFFEYNSENFNNEYKKNNLKCFNINYFDFYKTRIQYFINDILENHI